MYHEAANYSDLSASATGKKTVAKLYCGFLKECNVWPDIDEGMAGYYSGSSSDSQSSIAFTDLDRMAYYHSLSGYDLQSRGGVGVLDRNLSRIKNGVSSCVLGSNSVH